LPSGFKTPAYCLKILSIKPGLIALFTSSKSSLASLVAVCFLSRLLLPAVELISVSGFFSSPPLATSVFFATAVLFSPIFIDTDNSSPELLPVFVTTTFSSCPCVSFSLVLLTCSSAHLLKLNEHNYTQGQSPSCHPLYINKGIEGYLFLAPAIYFPML
jgi:hypothetical protein